MSARAGEDEGRGTERVTGESQVYWSGRLELPASMLCTASSRDRLLYVRLQAALRVQCEPSLTSQDDDDPPRPRRRGDRCRFARLYSNTMHHTLDTKFG